MFKTHALDLHEIRSRVANNLNLKDVASCARVNRDWNASFTPPLYSSVVLSIHGPSMESIESNKVHIRSLNIHRSVFQKLSSTSALHNVVSSVVPSSSLTSLVIRVNSIGNTKAQALAEVLKTCRALTTLDLGSNEIGDHGAQALSEAFKTKYIGVAL